MHPYWYCLFSNSGGGGERVLWVAVKSLIKSFPNKRIVIFTGDTESKSEILDKTKRLFGIDLTNRNDIEFIRLEKRKWIEATKYPVCTLLGQMIGSMILMFEALKKFAVPVVIDTHGQAAGYWFAKLSGVKVIAYVHYPFISIDMIQRVREMRPSYNNDAKIARARSVSYFKVFYYRILIKLYSFLGSFCDLAFCNSN